MPSGMLFDIRESPGPTSTPPVQTSLTGTLRAEDYLPGATKEAKINAMMADATSKGIKLGFISASMVPYNAALLTNLTAFTAIGGQLTREGGPAAAQGFDIGAYGAACDAVLSGNTATGTDDSAAWNAVATAVNSKTMGARILMPRGLSLFGTGLVFTKRVTVIGAPNASVMIFTGTGAAWTLNYTSTEAGLDGVGWAPGGQDVQLWRQGFDLTQIGLVLGGTNGAIGARFSNFRILGFATNLQLKSNLSFVEFAHVMFDAALKQIETVVGSSNAGENIGFLHCVMANGQNGTAGIDWKVTGFNANFVGCSIDGVQIALSAGTMHLVNCHVENLGTNGLVPHISISGGQMDIVGGELYITSTTFTPTAPIKMSGGTLDIYGLSAASVPAGVSGVVEVLTPAVLHESGTKDLNNFLNVIVPAPTGIVVTGPNTVQAQSATRPVTGSISGGGTFTPNLANGRRFEVTFTGNTGTIANPSNPIAGELFTVEVINSSSNSLLVTWGGNYQFAGPWVDPGFNSRHRIAFEINSSGNPVEIGRGLTRLTKEVPLVSGTTPALDASLGNYFTLAILTNIAVVVAVPSNPPPNALATQTIVVAIRNASGGALTTPPTFNTGGLGFKFAGGSIVNPGNGTQVLYLWQWDAVQAVWYLLSASAAL